ncbi:MAG: peptidylprolyl isomerase [Syntrophobacteraceae bacterium]
MKRVLMAWIVLSVFLFFATAPAVKSLAADSAGGERKVATVNGTVITQGQIDKESSRFEQQMSMRGGGEQASMDPAEVKKTVLDGLVARELLIQQSKKSGVTVADAEVDEHMSTLKKRFPTEADFTNTLAKMNLSEADLKSQYRQDMMVKKTIDQEVTSKVTVTGEETKAFYDGNPEVFKTPEVVRASHILVKVDSKATDAEKAKAKEKIEKIQARIKKGEDFAVVAKETSECPSSAQGGDLDFFQRGQMVKPFEDAAFAMKAGDTSGVVETEFGYHIIKVTDKKSPGVASYEEMKDKIEQHLKQQKTGQQLTQYVDQLKSSAKIEFEK